MAEGGSPKEPSYWGPDASLFYRIREGSKVKGRIERERRGGRKVKRAISVAKHLLEWPASGRGCVNFFSLAAIHRWAGFPEAAHDV